ncbi:MAG: methyl-accepting chemotaxis protein [Oscillospiraceae bacterium]|nr:methyl-accepting chemotaxis protein [Oscillospiraceae bacterium]
MEQTSCNRTHADRAHADRDLAQQLREALCEIHEAGLAIEKAIKRISDIVFQTGVLALNAAVEAARAGQQQSGAFRNRIKANKTALLDIADGLRVSGGIVADIAHQSEKQAASMAMFNLQAWQPAEVSVEAPVATPGEATGAATGNAPVGAHVAGSVAATGAKTSPPAGERPSSEGQGTIPDSPTPARRTQDIRLVALSQHLALPSHEGEEGDSLPMHVEEPA